MEHFLAVGLSMAVPFLRRAKYVWIALKTPKIALPGVNVDGPRLCPNLTVVARQSREPPQTKSPQK
jgi:hypothetical protein